MISTTDKNGIKYLVTLTDDKKNDTFFCEVYFYEDDWLDDSIDFFVIYKKELKGKNYEEQYEEAKKIAEEYVINSNYAVAKYDLDFDDMVKECKEYAEEDDCGCYEGYMEELKDITTIEELVNSGVFYDTFGKPEFMSEEHKVVFCWTEY